MWSFAEKWFRCILLKIAVSTPTLSLFSILCLLWFLLDCTGVHAADIGVWLANRFHLDPTVGLGYRYRMMQLLLRKKTSQKVQKSLLYSVIEIWQLYWKSKATDGRDGPVRGAILFVILNCNTCSHTIKQHASQMRAWSYSVAVLGIFVWRD